MRVCYLVSAGNYGFSTEGADVYSVRVAFGLPSLAGHSLNGALSRARDLGFQSAMSLFDGPRTAHSLAAFPTPGFYSLTEEGKREVADA